MAKAKEKLLTEAQVKKIIEMIREKQNIDDPSPEEVIKKRFKGDRKAYARTMAVYHDIPLD